MRRILLRTMAEAPIPRSSRRLLPTNQPPLTQWLSLRQKTNVRSSAAYAARPRPAGLPRRAHLRRPAGPHHPAELNRPTGLRRPARTPPQRPRRYFLSRPPRCALALASASASSAAASPATAASAATATAAAATAALAAAPALATAAATAAVVLPRTPAHLPTSSAARPTHGRQPRPHRPARRTPGWEHVCQAFFHRPRRRRPPHRPARCASMQPVEYKYTRHACLAPPRPAAQPSLGSTRWPVHLGARPPQQPRWDRRRRSLPSKPLPPSPVPPNPAQPKPALDLSLHLCHV